MPHSRSMRGSTRSHTESRSAWRISFLRCSLAFWRAIGRLRGVDREVGARRGDGDQSAPIMITADEFAELVNVSRRQLDRLRISRPLGFPREYDLGSGGGKHHRCPRFKRADVLSWIETRALW